MIVRDGPPARRSSSVRLGATMPPPATSDGVVSTSRYIGRCFMVSFTNRVASGRHEASNCQMPWPPQEAVIPCSPQARHKSANVTALASGCA